MDSRRNFLKATGAGIAGAAVGAVSTASAKPATPRAYPEPSRFGAMPAHGFFIRHVKGLDMRDVEIKYMKEDLRPAFVLDDVQGAQLIHVRAQHATGVPSFVLKNVENFSVYQSKPVADTDVGKVAQKQL